MRRTPTPEYQRFSQRFVREYWEDVISHSRSEPVEQTTDEILAEVIYCVDADAQPGRFRIHMSNSFGDSWNFAVRFKGRDYEITGMDDGRQDLFDAIYGPTFRAMMGRILAKCRATGYR